MKKNLSLGFTLLELLVVISIIGILIAMSSVAFATAQQKSRNARRLSDIKALQDGFEQFYAINTFYDDYATMTGDPELFPAGAPTDPKPTFTYDFTQSSSSDYCICAEVEGTTGNSNADCASMGITNGTHYCLVNLQ